MVDVPTIERALRRLGITGQFAALLMVAFGVLVIPFPSITDILLGCFLIVTGLMQLGGGQLALRLTRKRLA